MRDWQRQIAKSLSRKRGKLNSSFFEKFSQNWLLIYDFPSFGSSEMSYKLTLLYLSALFAQPCKGIDFDMVFIVAPDGSERRTSFEEARELVAIAGKQKALALASDHEENAAPLDGNHVTEPNGEQPLS